MTLTTAQRAALTRAISADRLSTYQREATRSARDEIDLYLWDRDVAAAAMADIAILEVAMRNAMSAALERRAGQPDWYSRDIGLDNRSLSALARAWQDVPATRRTPGRVVAQLMFGFWRNLLESGGDAGIGPLKHPISYETLWRQDLHTAFRGGRLTATEQGTQFTRGWTLALVKDVHALRNRAAHHEPLFTGIPLPGEQRRITTAHAHTACVTLARTLDRDLADWLTTNSRLNASLADDPRLRS